MNIGANKRQTRALPKNREAQSLIRQVEEVVEALNSKLHFL